MRIGLPRYKNRGFNRNAIRANRFARIALRIARATKPMCVTYISHWYHDTYAPVLGSDLVGTLPLEIWAVLARAIAALTPPLQKYYRQLFLFVELIQEPRKGSRTKNQPKEEVFGTDIPRTSGGHSRGYPGPKLRSGP